MFTRKQHIVRKTLIIASSFVMGATLTLFAASAYDASVQSRATKIFESIKSNASSMNQTDSMAYYSLVRMNIKTLIEVLSLVETNLSGEIISPPILTSSTSTTPTPTTPVASTNTGVNSVNPTPSISTGSVVTSNGSTPVQINPPVGWSRVDGPKSIYPKTTEDLKFICKEGYRLPTNAEWEKLRQPGAGDLFTKEAQKLGLSSAYYWTQEGDIFYVMNGESGYLNPVKGDDRERIRNIAHYTRCIANDGTVSVGNISSSKTLPDLNLQSYVGKTLPTADLMTQYLFKYNGESFYAELVNKFKIIENAVAPTVTKVQDLGAVSGIAGTNRDTKRTIQSPVGISYFIQKAIDASAQSLRSPNDGNLALEAYNSTNELKMKLFLAAPSVCPDGTQVYETWYARQYLDQNLRSNMCQFVGQERYFIVYFGKTLDQEKITKSYNITLPQTQNSPDANFVCESQYQTNLFGKGVVGTLDYIEYVFNRSNGSTLNYFTKDLKRYGNCTGAQYQLTNAHNPGTHNSTDVWEVKSNGYSFASNVCMSDARYVTGTSDSLPRLSSTVGGTLTSISAMKCHYKFTVNP